MSKSSTSTVSNYGIDPQLAAFFEVESVEAPVAPPIIVMGTPVAAPPTPPAPPETAIIPDSSDSPAVTREDQCDDEFDASKFDPRTHPAFYTPVPAPDYVMPPLWGDFLFKHFPAMHPKMLGIAFKGPRGTGKNLAIEQFCLATGRLLLRVECNETMEAEHLIGVARISGGTDRFQPGPFTLAALASDWCRKHSHPGVVLQLTEFNAMRAGTQLAMNGVMDRVQAGFYVAQIAQRISWEAPMVMIDYNEGSSYAGTRALNPAVLDRFEHIVATYLPRAHEIALLVARTGCPENLAETAVDLANSVREEVRKGNPEIEFDFSFRRLQSFGYRVASGQHPYDAWLQSVIWAIDSSDAGRSTRNSLIEFSKVANLIDPTSTIS